MLENTKVLYIEDNFENRMLIRRLLQAEGIQVIEAENAEEAVLRMRSSLPDLILMDINLPRVDGYTLTQHLKAIHGLQHIPIVALTANVMKGDREKTIQAGCDGYIEKPIDVDSFVDSISSYLKR